MFAYCQNNPVKYADTEGTFINTITGALIGGIIGAINAAIEGDDVWAGAAIGAATGALAGAAADIAIATGGIGAIAIAAAGGAIASGLNYIGNEVVNDRQIKAENLALEMTIGAAANVLTFGAGAETFKKVGGKVLSNMTKNFTQTVMKNTTKVVGGKVVKRATSIVTKRIIKNSLMAIAETAVISGGAWLNSKGWGRLIK